MLPLQRIAVLSVALEAASSRLDALHDQGVLTTDLLEAMAGRGKYVPDHVLSLARTASTANDFACHIADHGPFMRRVVSEMQMHDATLATDRIESMLSLVALPTKASEEWHDQSRALHVRRALDLAYGLLEEISKQGLAEIPAAVSSYHSIAVGVDERPLFCRSRDDVLAEFSSLAASLGLARESALLSSVIGWKPSVYRPNLFTYHSSRVSA